VIGNRLIIRLRTLADQDSSTLCDYRGSISLLLLLSSWPTARKLSSRTEASPAWVGPHHVSNHVMNNKLVSGRYVKPVLLPTTASAPAECREFLLRALVVGIAAITVMIITGNRGGQKRMNEPIRCESPTRNFFGIVNAEAEEQF
jgi:hypothetical protein